MDSFVYDIERIKRTALEMGLPKYRVAEKAGVSAPTVGKLWRGERVTETTIAKIAQALGLNLADLVISAAEQTAGETA